MADADTEIGFAQLGLGSVLKQNQLAVPANQRDYAWELKYVRTLFQDFARELDGPDRQYFLGTIVTIPRPNSLLEVVDGQQRLATTAILLSAIRDYLRSNEKDLSDSIDSDFLSVFNRHTRTRVPRLKLNVDDNDYFRLRLTSTSGAPSPTKPSHNLLNDACNEAARQVKAIVAKLDPKDHGNALNRWIDFIEKRASVILLRVPNATNAYRMFETLNDRGKRVSQSDLVKNYIFGEAGERLHEVQQSWAFMRGALESMESEDTTITFLRYALTVIRGFVRDADVYEAVQKHSRGEQPVVTFSAQLDALSNTYVAVHNSDHERWNNFGDQTRRALEVLNLFDISPMKALLLAIGQTFSEKEVGNAFQFCVSLGVRLMITNSTRSGTVEEGLASAAHGVYKKTVESADQLKSLLKNMNTTDGIFRTAFESATVSNRKLARYYLRSLEMSSKDEKNPWHIPNDDKSVINLEHILPDKPERNWPQFTDDDVKLYRNRIGNLTLLRSSDNSEIKSIGFNEKKRRYSECPYNITSQIASYTEWTPAKIIERQKSLAVLAVKTWPI
jgi:hypothetical protein